MRVEKTLRRREQADERSQINPHRILVVDDNEDIRSLNTEVLANSGYEVDSAADGALAWDSLRINDYDLLLTDYGMPRVNGLNLIKKLRAAHMTIPVILVSGRVPKEEMRHPRLHIEATLPQPYTLDELLASVRKALSASNSMPAGPCRCGNHKSGQRSSVAKHFPDRKLTLKQSTHET